MSETPTVPGEDRSVRLPDRLPLFPLPNLVAFPGLAVPLRVFEPRFRQMMEDLDRSQPFLGLAVLAPGWESDYQGDPPIHPVVVGGLATQVSRRESGDFHFVFMSLARVRVFDEEPRQRLYRVGRVGWIAPDEEDASHLVLKLELYRSLERWLASQGKYQAELDRLRSADPPLGRVVDAMAAVIPMPVETKAMLLSEFDAGKRAHLLLALIPTPDDDAPAVRPD